MGAGFVILIHLALLFILSSLIALIAGLITVFASQENKRRKVFIALSVPYVWLYSLYFLFLFSAGYVSVKKNVDIGIGDCWYVPLNDSCSLTMIDLPEQAYIDCNGTDIIDKYLSHIQQTDNMVYGKTFGDTEYYSINISNSTVQKFATENELIANEHIQKIDWIEAETFYRNRWNDLAGKLTTIMEILSVTISIVIAVSYCWLVLVVWKFLFDKKKSADELRLL